MRPVSGRLATRWRSSKAARDNGPHQIGDRRTLPVCVLPRVCCNVIVDWFDQVDTTYRNELREQNEANFARFDAKLEQRIAELRSEFQWGLSELRTELRVGLAEMRSALEKSLRVQTAWFFVAWATMFATMVALELRR